MVVRNSYADYLWLLLQLLEGGIEALAAEVSDSCELPQVRASPSQSGSVHLNSVNLASESEFSLTLLQLLQKTRRMQRIEILRKTGENVRERDEKLLEDFNRMVGVRVRSRPNSDGAVSIRSLRSI